MRRFGRTLAMLAIAMMTTLMVVDLAEARRAGGGFGSRGSRTFSPAPVTRTAPNNANSIDRTMTPRPEGQSATQPGFNQPGAAQTRPGAQRPGGLFGGFGGSMLGGLMMGGLIGMMLGGGMGGGIGFLGLLLQVALIFGAITLAMRFFGRRQQPAYSAGPQSATGNGPLHREQAYGGTSAAKPSFKIPQIGGGSAAPKQAVADTDEIGVGGDDLSRFETMLKEVQAAYGAEDYATLRKLTTPEAMSYLAEELSDNATSGLRNEVRDVHLVQGDVAEAWNEEGRDYATVAMRYESIDVMRDRNTGRVVEGDPDKLTEAVELWTFVRRPGGEWQVSAIQGAS
ncbi:MULTISPECIES: Tim44 domain-containing protein [unclassified Rhizobium]|uniref:Tim44 domain-containing protein n=1 Tax=unclassified Rhizobium TaxID=2613769 RepID=UPI0012E3B3CD|nr:MULTISPECIES: Tim44 domain-containing protein [unclassified Rhizobium]